MRIIASRNSDQPRVRATQIQIGDNIKEYDDDTPEEVIGIDSGKQGSIELEMRSGATWTLDPTDTVIVCSSKVTAAVEDRYYFGREEYEKFGDMIAKKLAGQTVSKRRDTAEEPGGLIYEANKLGIDMWDLLRALEGMCYNGRAREIDDSTYLIK